MSQASNHPLPKVQSSLSAKKRSNRQTLAPIEPRPSSAQANMQSHPCFQGSLFYDNQRAAGSYKLWRERTTRFRTKEKEEAEKQKDYQLENVIWTQSVKHPRRLTVTNTQDISDWEIMILKRQKSYAVAALGDLKGKLEEKMNLDALNELYELFMEADADNTGTLDLDEFKRVVKGALKIQGRNDEEIAALFMKIDSSSDGKISWEEFCSFMQLNYSEKEDAIKRQKEVAFNVPARTENNPHRHAVQKVLTTGDNQFMIMAADGQVTFWAPNGGLKTIRKDIIEKRITGKGKGEKQEGKRSRQKWMTDCIVMTEFSKLIVGTGDCELQFWEFSSFGFEPYCQVCSLDTAPLKIAYSCTDRDCVTIAYGDTDGCVNIFIFTAMGETLRLWKASPLIAQMPTIPLQRACESKTLKYIRWKVHNDWVEQIRIETRLNQVISCSNDEEHALVIGYITPSTDIHGHAAQQQSSNTGANSTVVSSLSQNLDTTSTITLPNVTVNATSTTTALSTTNNTNPQPTTAPTTSMSAEPRKQSKPMFSTLIPLVTSASSSLVKRRAEKDETVFPVYKGVKTFDFSMEKNLLITGGMDRIIRLYNPYVPARPIARLKNHNSPICFIYLSNEDNRIFTMSTDKCLNVWDMIDHSCLSCVRPKLHKISGEVQACSYNPNTKSMLICTDKVSLLSLKIKTDLRTEVILSHKEAVTCCMYNKQFKQLISCTEAGVVKLWDLETGKDLFEYSNAHDDTAITCMSFDETGRRLITGGRDGTCKLWNFNNGHCMKILRKDNRDEISDVRYIRIYNNKFIVSVGWDRRINIYDDDSDDVRLYADPNPRWTDDIEHGHKEDILCIAKSETNLLATAGYDGEVIVWNMVSGHIFCKINSPRPNRHDDDSLDGDLSVNKLIFLSREHLGNKYSAHLITSGPWGMIHFWNIFNGNELYARFKVLQWGWHEYKKDKKGNQVCQMITDSKFRFLFAADNHGYIYQWDIFEYASKHKEKHPPTLLSCWRAHTSNINAIEYIESAKVIVSCSNDCTIRVWTPDGRFVGTFGQQEAWNLYDPKTYKHPLVPYDILVDDESLPTHPVISQKETFIDVLEEPESEEAREKEKEKEKAAKQFHSINRPPPMDDEKILQEIKNMQENKNNPLEKLGKRLRHEKQKTIILPDRNVKSYYQTLKCYDIQKPPEVEQPELLRNKSKNENY